MQTQAEKYWPPVGEEVHLANVNITIRCVSEEKINSEGMRTKIILQGPQGEKVVEHDHVKANICSGLAGGT